MITQHSGVLYHLPEIFHAANVRITLIGRPKYPLDQSPYVHHFIPLLNSGLHDPDESFVEDLVATGIFNEPESLGDWVIVAEDKELKILSESALQSEILSRVLPARNALGQSLFDSKVALSQVLSQLNIAQPQSRIAMAASDLNEILRASQKLVLIKADRGHGGVSVTRVSTPHDFELDKIPTEWFPVIVQEFVDGDLCAVEAQFVEGQLVGFLFSTVLKTFSPFGTSTDRLFTAPPDDQVELALRKLGEAGEFHGFANCTFIKNYQTGEFLLIEVDLRPNIWHQYGPKLGVDWVALYREPPPRPVHNIGTQRVANFPRSLTRAIKHRDIASMWLWISRRPGTWDMRNKNDPAINRAELRALLLSPLRKLAQKSKLGFSALGRRGNRMG